MNGRTFRWHDATGNLCAEKRRCAIVWLTAKLEVGNESETVPSTGIGDVCTPNSQMLW